MANPLDNATIHFASHIRECMPPRANPGLARDLCMAFIAYRQGVSFRTAEKNYGSQELGSVWYWLAYLAEQSCNAHLDEVFARVHGPVSKPGPGGVQ